MAEEGAQTSIAARIAALKLNQVGRVPTSPPPSYDQATQNGHNHTGQNGRPRAPPPPLPNRRPELSTAQSDSPPEVNGTSNTNGIGNQPAAIETNGHATQINGHGRPPPSLPPRRPTGTAPPSLPPRRPSEAPSFPSRRPSEQLSRQDSKESVASTMSAKSGYSVASNRTGTSARTSSSSGQQYAVRAPAYDPATLPPLPPKRNKDEAPNPRATLSKTTSTSAVPSRPALPSRTSTTSSHIAPDPPRRTEPPPPRKSALTQGFSNGNDKPPILPSKRPEPAPAPSIPSRPATEPPDPSLPPPIPTGSRPDLSQLKLSKPKSTTSTAPTTGSGPAPITAPGCLICRDFSAADAHAARFPRESIPSHDVAWLSHQLTSPFPSATDKARAVFVWLHHNVVYNVDAFFAGNIQPSTPSSTIASGLAVCEGYAGLFVALCCAAGLQARVVGGHGKGYGYNPVQPGQAVPPFSAGHAWAVVLIDEGWKLCDPCWGAGALDTATNGYSKRFNAWEFVKSNEDFGRTHFPEDRQSFYRVDGRCPGWEEYLLGEDGAGEGPRFCGGFSTDEGTDEKSIEPKAKDIRLGQVRAVGSGRVRFCYTKVCPHWDPERNGKGKLYLSVIITKDRNGKETFTPLESNGWASWLDVTADELGPPGGVVKLMVITVLNGTNARGLTADEFNHKKKTNQLRGWQLNGVATWDVVA